MSDKSGFKQPQKQVSELHHSFISFIYGEPSTTLSNVNIMPTTHTCYFKFPSSHVRKVTIGTYFLIPYIKNVWKNFNTVISIKIIEIVFHTKSAKSGVHFIFIVHFSLDWSHLGISSCMWLWLPHWIVQFLFFLPPKAAVKIR